jgi:hypothetical protein
MSFINFLPLLQLDLKKFNKNIFVRFSRTTYHISIFVYPSGFHLSSSLPVCLSSCLCLIRPFDLLSGSRAHFCAIKICHAATKPALLHPLELDDRVGFGD